MSKRDTKHVAKRKRQAFEWGADVKPSKKQKKEKAAERQDGKKEIRDNLKRLYLMFRLFR